MTVNDESPRNILLKIAMAFGLTSQPLAIRETSLSQKQIRTTLDELTKTRLLQSRPMRAVQKDGQGGRPENAYLLTKKGATECQQLWPDEPVRTLADGIDDLAVAHRYVQALVARSLPGAEIEQQLYYGERQNMRIDVLVPLPNGKKRLIEIEQALGRNNLPRVVKKLLGLNALYHDRAGKMLANEVLLIFNLRESELAGVVRSWEDALGKVSRPGSNRPYMLRYALLGEFLKNANIEDVSAFPVMKPRYPAASAAASGDGVARLLDPSAAPRLDQMLLVFQIVMDSYESLARSVSLEGQPDPRLRLQALFELAILVYEPSLGDEGDTRRYASFPSESLFYLRHYLHMPQNASLLAELTEGLAWVNSRQTGLVMYRDAITRVIWDVLLRSMGMGRGGPLRVYVRVPDMGGRESDLQIVADLDLGFNDTSLGISYHTQEKGKQALSWLLSALFMYSADLGLGTSLWSRKPKKGKNQDDTEPESVD